MLIKAKREETPNTYIKYINVKDHEVKGEGESHGHQQVDVDPGVHHQQGLVLRDGVQGVGHLDGDKDRQSHGHGLGSLENFT